MREDDIDLGVFGAGDEEIMRHSGFSWLVTSQFAG
jgi:hypothetical protein